MTRHSYNLGFIPDQDIYDYVKQTVLLYTDSIDLASFNKNIIDPIKLTFDAKIYGQTFDEVVVAECHRQIDKTNQNHLGYFHQNLFKLVGNGWTVPTKGFDIENSQKHIFVEMKTKHNTMNAGGALAVVLMCQDKLIADPQATCYLVEVIAKKSQDIPWAGTYKGHKIGGNPRLRRMSIDKFYELVFNDREAFMKLCKALPLILDDILDELNKGKLKNTVLAELNALSSNTFKSLYLLAFKTYAGFNNF